MTDHMSINKGLPESQGAVEGTFTPYFFKLFKKTFDCEIELLQGEVKELENGCIWFKIELTGYKYQMMEEFCRNLMALPSDKIKVKFKGLPINPN